MGSFVFGLLKKQFNSSRSR